MNGGKKMAVVIVWTKLIGLRQNVVSKNWITFGHAQFTVAICGSRYRMQWNCPKVSGMCVGVTGG